MRLLASSPLRVRQPVEATNLSYKGEWAETQRLIQERAKEWEKGRDSAAGLLNSELSRFLLETKVRDGDKMVGLPITDRYGTLVAASSEPYTFRESNGCTLGKVFQPCSVEKPESIATPLIEAHAGDPVRIHVFGASNKQNGMFSVEKHERLIEPFMRDADQISGVEPGDPTVSRTSNSAR